MPTFSYTATRGGREVTLTWTDGRVTGDDAQAVAQVEAFAAGYEGSLPRQPLHRARAAAARAGQRGAAHRRRAAPASGPAARGDPLAPRQKDGA